MVVRVNNRQSISGTWPSLPHVTVLLTGISILPTQSGGISVLPAGAQLHAIDDLRTGLQATATKPLSYLEFVPPPGQLDPSLTFSFSWSDAGLTQTQGTDPAITEFLNSTISATSEEFGVSGGGMHSASTASAEAPDWNPTACKQLLTGSEHSNPISTSNLSVQLAANIPAQLSQGSTGYPSDRSPQALAGAWCRPAPSPFAYSGPLSNRAFWTPIAVVLFGIGVLWLSRGVKLPP